MSVEDSITPVDTTGGKRRRRRGAKARAQADAGERKEDGGNKESPKNDLLLASPASAAKSASSLKRKSDGLKMSTDAKDGGSGNGTGIDNINGNKNKRRKKKKAKPPQPGEEGYLTKTQLRNAAKRKAKKLKKLQEQSQSQSLQQQQSADGNKASGTGIGSKQKSKRTRSKVRRGDDPSTRYIENPKSAPLVNKAKKFFQREGLNIPFDIHLGEVSGWRTVSKLPARYNINSNEKKNTNKKKVIIGLFRPGSHSIVAVPKCIAHHPSINNAITILQDECDKMGIQPYDESEGKGHLRYVCLNVERRTGKVQMTLVWNSHPYKQNPDGDGDDINDDDDSNSTSSEGRLLLEKFTKHLVSKSNSIKMHSLWVHFNGQWKHASNIFDYGSSSDEPAGLWRHVHGPKFIVEKLDLGNQYSMKDDEVSLHFPPNVFRQANLNAFTNIVIAIRKYLIEYNKHTSRKGREDLPTCLELYGGVGTIGLNVIDLVSAFTSSDENPYNKECFEKSVELLSTHNRKKCKYIPKNATDVIREDNVLSDNCEIVIVDPPRKGLDDYVVQSFIDSVCASEETGPQLLVYVSCGFDAFVRDCDRLLESKRWRLAQGEGHLLFPGSDAIETLAFFHRI